MKTLVDREDSIFNPPQSGCVLSLTGLPGGDGKIYDRSPYGNIGTMTGATWVMLPTGLWCLSFDGSDDYVDCGNNASLQGLTKFTAMVWIYSDDVTTDKTAIGKGDMFTNGCWHIKNQGGDIYVRMRWSGTHQIYTAISISTWYQIALRYSDADDLLQLYLNGLLKDEVTVTDFVGDSIRSLFLGRIQDAGMRWDGLVALPHVYNRALSALEIQNHFNQGKHLFGVW